ncbi:hypothetical protein G4B84_011198 [Aspergillus flavus NRRL3357]|nr:uncharacterized protein G4B84_011198 [Aspergillus flavus NRRL3357]QMW35707.1 hypothetical protein G4B84_011198 [Aspergillus flavus NRRL3357]QMW47769.1 hypothetical protein G4B11_011248 [Aspergillus flavus]
MIKIQNAFIEVISLVPIVGRRDCEARLYDLRRYHRNTLDWLVLEESARRYEKLDEFLDGSALWWWRNFKNSFCVEVVVFFLSSEYYGSDSAGDHAEEEVEASRRSYIPYADLRRETAKDWRISGGISKVLAWRPNGKVGCSVIAAYEENGVQTARVEAAGRRPFRKTKRTHIAYQCRGKKKRRDGKYWHEDHIIGIGLVSWRVEATYLKDPTAILRPTEKAWYPETYINILWNDNVWTWESRDNFRFIRGSRSYETNIYIYCVAIAKIVNVDEERLTDLEEESVADANSVGESLEDFIDDAVEIPETEYAESVGEDGRPVYDEAVSEEYDSQSAAEEESQQSNRIRYQYPRRRSRESVVAETVEHRRSSSRIGPQRHTSRAREDDLQDIPESVHRGLSASRSALQRQTSRRRELESQTQNISSSRHTAKDRRRHPLTPPRSRTETPRAVQQHHRSKQSRSRSAIPPLSPISPISEVGGSRSRGSQPRNHRGHGQPSSRQTLAPKRSQEEEYRRKASSMPRERDSSRIPSQRQSGKLRRTRNHDFDAVRQGLYREEYDAATTLIASLIWSEPGERPQQAIDQLNELNVRIRAKNPRSKRKPDYGTVDIAFFSKFGDDIDKAALAYINNKRRDKFFKAQGVLRSVIKNPNLLDNWNIDWEQFQDYCGGRRLESPETETAYDDQGSDDEQSVSSIISKYEQGSEGEDNAATSSLDQSSDSASESNDDADSLSVEWRSCESLEHSCRQAEKEYGVPFTPGVTLGWRSFGRTKYSLIVGHQYQGKMIARVVSSANTPKNRETSIDLNARGHIKGTRKYTSAFVQGTGLVAWRVGEANELNPTASLRPDRDMSYPETYVGVLWDDGAWTWESRENFRSIMGDLTPLQTDILIYRWATSQDAEYKEALTGQRPKYPAISPFDVQHTDTLFNDEGDTGSEAESLSIRSFASERSTTPSYSSEGSLHQPPTRSQSNQVRPARMLRFQRLQPASVSQTSIMKTDQYDNRHQFTRFPRYGGTFNR